MTSAWTDYPIEELGDIPNQLAPIRAVEVLDWDGDKYANVLVQGIKTNIKLGYIYSQPGRLGHVPKLSSKQIDMIPVV